MGAEGGTQEFWPEVAVLSDEQVRLDPKQQRGPEDLKGNPERCKGKEGWGLGVKQAGLWLPALEFGAGHVASLGLSFSHL